jgi:hypothetical protein
VWYNLRSRKLLGADPDHLTVYALPAAEGGCRNDRRSHALIYKVNAVDVRDVRDIGNIRHVSNVGHVHLA